MTGKEPNELAEINQIENELYDTFISFYNFSLGLIEKVDNDNNYLKFAVVNVQIALELFLKYYFVKKGQIDAIVTRKNGHDVRFKEFSDVLNFFFASRNWSYGEKKELRKILEIRNSIVHNGLNSGWNEELALYIIKCIFFIQGTIKSNFGNTLLQQHYKPSNLAKNKVWRKGVEEFVEKINNEYGFQVFHCLDCGANTLISNELFRLEDSYSSGEQLQCLCCFQYIDLEVECTLINCYYCKEPDSYLINKLNEQTESQYIGKCLECGVDTWVRKCSYCGRFYHPIEVKEYKSSNKFYCSLSCYEIDGK